MSNFPLLFLIYLHQPASFQKQLPRSLLRDPALSQRNFAFLSFNESSRTAKGSEQVGRALIDTCLSKLSRLQVIPRGGGRLSSTPILFFSRWEKSWIEGARDQGPNRAMLFCWGDGSYGQLGLGEEGASQPVPLRRDPPAVGVQEVVLVACGERHTLLLLADGSLASCGDNAQGQLGKTLSAGRRRCYLPGKSGTQPALSERASFRAPRIVFPTVCPGWPFQPRCGLLGRGSWNPPPTQRPTSSVGQQWIGSHSVRWKHSPPIVQFRFRFLE